MPSARCCSGLYDDGGTLHHVGVTSAFTMAVRKSLVQELEPLRKSALEGHPWREWADEDAHGTRRMPGGQKPLDRRQGPVVGAAAHRARLRGQVRPPAGRSLPPRDALPALASRQAAEGLPLRSARGHDALRAEEGFRGARSTPLPRPPRCRASCAPLRRLDARRLARLLGVLRRPGRIALAFLLVAPRQFEQPSSEYARSSIPRWRSPISAKRAGIVAIVKAAGSQSATSLQSSGAETRASGVGRIEYAPATVRSLAFWL